MKQCSANANLLILGAGLVANALATVLNGILVDRRADDADWDWPPERYAKVFRLILVAPAGASASQIVRWHCEARSCEWIFDAYLVIVCVDQMLIRELLVRDVFARSVNSGESFADWKAKGYVGISKISDGFAGIVNSLAGVKSLLLDSWLTDKKKVSILPTLMGALESENTAELESLMAELGQMDWDAFCSHTYANRINRWLASVTDGVAPSWGEGRALFRPLIQSRK